MLKRLLFLVMILMPVFFLGQADLDSLWRVWSNKANVDTVRLKALNQFYREGYLFSDPDSAFYFAEIERKFAIKSGLKENEANAINSQGITYHLKGDYKNALSYYNKAIEIYTKIGDMEGVQLCYGNMGVIYVDLSEYKKALDLCDKSLKICQEINDKEGIAGCYLNMGAIYEAKGETTKAISFFEKSLEIEVLRGDKFGIAAANNNLAYMHTNQGNVKKAIDYYSKSIFLYKEINNKEALANTYSNLGGLYAMSSNYKKALEYQTEALNLRNDLGDKKGISNSYIVISSIYLSQKDYLKTKEFYDKALVLKEKLDDKRGLVELYLSYGYFYLETAGKDLGEEFDFSSENQTIVNLNEGSKESRISLALEYFAKSLEMSDEIEFVYGVAKSNQGLGEIAIVKNRIKEAINYIVTAHKLSLELDNIDLIKSSSKLLYESYKKLGEDIKALEMHELYIKMKDSVESEENQRAIIQEEYRSNYEKQAALDSIIYMEAQKIKETEISKQREELKYRKYQQYFLFGGLSLMLLFFIYVVKKNKEVKAQKLEVEKQKEFAEEQQQITEKQRQILGHQNQEIKDSIVYAQNLQSSVLPSKLDVTNNFENNFILFKPKDVVSGDFYWTYKKNEYCYLAVIDCTGHGVPGAFMTIVANNLLNEIIQDDITTPKDIVSELHKRIKIRVGGSPTAQVRDSMDLGLYRYDKSNKEVLFVGTHTNLYLVRNNVLESIKGSKADIGYKDSIALEEHKVTVEKNDMLYMHSDGYPDQKGGPKGKKFYYKPIRDKFEEINLLNLMEQEKVLSETFENWKGSIEQFDDVCMIGVRI